MAKEICPVCKKEVHPSYRDEVEGVVLHSTCFNAFMENKNRASNFARGISMTGEEKSINNDLKKFSIPILLLIILVTIITASAENLDEYGAAFTVLTFVSGFSLIFCVLSWFVIALSEKAKKFSNSLFGARVLVVFHIWTLILFIMIMNLSPIEIEGSEYFCQTIGGETTCYTDQDMENLINKYE